MRGFIRYLVSKYGKEWHNKIRGEDKTSDIRKDVRAARECISRIDNSSWWKWSGGPTLFFWR